MSRARHQEAEPETRVGHCCGCHQTALLFKIPGIFRYRCSTCYERETGHRHHLLPLETQAVTP